MNKLYSMVGVAAMLLAFFSISAISSPKTATWTGWISDSACGAKGTSAAHKQCALACVHEKGAKFVFVSEQKAVHVIRNQDKIKDSEVGEEVRVTGRLLKDGSIEVKSVSPAT